MRPGAAPVLQDVKFFQESTLSCLDEQSSGTFAGTSKYGTVCWIAKGAQLEVLDMVTLHRRAAWQFGRVLGDQHTTITCVEELLLKNDSKVKLLVGISNSTPNGLLCVFNLNTNMIEKAIEIPHPVTAVEVVCTCMGDSVPRWALSEHLSCFCGIVAVGCSDGHAYLIDLQLDDKDCVSSEEAPSKLQFISPRNRDIEHQRQQSLMKGLHLCMSVNGNLYTNNGFEYQKPDGVVMKTFRAELVTVTCLTYIPQTGILAIGYNFGCYQLWKLQVPVLEYSSRLETEPMPVTHITHQEPENDPKNFCYLWVARSQLDPEEEYANSVASISLYQLSFGGKAHYNSYGVFYDDLTSICLRLDHELTSQPIQYGSNFDGTSRVLACYTLSNPYYQPPTRLTEDSFDEANRGPDLSLCLFMWEVTEGTKIKRHLAVFDINRWYHAQMPSTVRYVSASVETCSFMCFYKLNDGRESLSENLLTAYIDTSRVQRFRSNSPLPPEQHFYPSSLEFGATLIFDCGTVKIKFLGDQGQVLSDLRKKGPTLLVHPQEFYTMCVYVGLLARPMEIFSTNMNVGFHRESLLSLALDYNILSLFKSCVVEWANGEFLSQGCSLKFLLDWAWQKVSSIKHQIDTTCVNLYNWSGLIWDQRSTRTLYRCEQKLSHLVSIFKLFTSQSVPITEQGEFEIQSKIFVTSLLAQHLSVVLWFIHVGLLPENDDTEEMSGFRYAYPITSLLSAYKARRSELQSLNSGTEVLMIDGLVESSEGVAELWEREGGNGRYPPPSLHALLSTYLLEGVDITTKHSLTLYLLLDLVSMETPADTVTFSDKIVGFTNGYKLPQRLVKQIQAFWLLEHKDFEEAVVLLETQRITSDFSHWQHRYIMQTLLNQGEVKSAQRYLYIANPPLYSMDDIKLKLTVLLANGFVTEALDYQRKASSKTNMKELLLHVFHGCQQTKTVDRMLGHLEVDEEKMLEEYLESCDPLSMDILVMYYLQSSRIVEAFHLNEKLKQYALTEASPKARERAAARNAIVDKYIAIYPDIQRKLLFEQIHVPKRNSQWRRVVRRPTPLSTRVTKKKVPVMTQSTYIMKIMETIDEIETKEESPERTLNKSVGPFLCTPVIPSRKSFLQSPTSVYLDTEDRTEKTPSGVFQKSLIMNGATPTSVSKRQSRFFSASCLTLLQTPKVKKVTPEKQRRSATSLVTPQSILKVRNLVSLTSPSPHSGGSTPSSQETGTSSKKMPRKLGYSSQSGTPKSVGVSDPSLTGLPRHLIMEVQTASQPTTPKSVSFVEPSSPTISPPIKTPKQVNTSQTATPKSVSFFERSVTSAAQLQPLSTPKRPEKKTPKTSPPAPHRLSPRSVTPSSSSKSLKERSPTPESSQHSPRFAGELDQLCRRPLHGHSPNGTDQDENLVLKLEESDENISDEDVEMETSQRGGPNLDSSVTSTVSGESVILVTSKKSPEKQDKSIVDKPSPASKTDKENRMSVDMETDSEEPGVEMSPGKIEPVSASDNMGMEVEEEGIVLSNSRELFSPDEEVPNASIDTDDDKADIVTSSNDLVEMPENVVIKQEADEQIYETPQPMRHLSPTSSFSPKASPRNVKVKDSPPSTSEDVTTTLADTFQDDFIKEVDTIFGESPDIDDMKQSLPGRSGMQTRKSRITGKFKFEGIIDEKVKQEVDSESDAKLQLTPTRSFRRKKEQEVVVTEPKETLTPTRSSRRARKDPESPATPTRSSRKANKEEKMGVVMAKSPKSFSRKAKEAVQESLLSISSEIKSANEASPTEMTKIRNKTDHGESPSRTPTRSSRRNKTQNDIEDNLEAEKTTPSRRKGKKSDITEESANNEQPVTPTRGRKKTENVIENDLPVKQSRSPARNRNTNNSEKVHTPTRRQRKLDNESESVIESENNDREPVTPTRKSARQSIEKFGVVDLPDDIGSSEIPVDLPDSEPGTPSRRVSLSRASKEKAEISLLALTPTRRRSLGRASKQAPLDKSPEPNQTDDNEKQKTPTRRRTEKAEEDVEQSPDREVKVPDSSDQTEVKRTPGRRGRQKKVEEDIKASPAEGPKEETDQAEIKKTPTRRGGRTIKEDSDTKETTAVQDTGKKTPTRRGRQKKTEADLKEEVGNAENEKALTPSRRKRAKTEEKVDTQSRRTRSHDDKQEIPDMYNIQSTSFQFSNPMETDSTEVLEPPKAFTPVKSFIFSPPIQQARSRLAGLEEGVKKTSEEEAEQPGQSADNAVDEMEDKVDTKKPVRKSRMKKLYKESEEILLISPVSKDDSTITEEGLSIVTRATRAGTRKADNKKDSSKSAVQSVLSNIGKRPRRTTHRIGPVGQKK